MIVKNGIFGKTKRRNFAFGKKIVTLKEGEKVDNEDYKLFSGLAKESFFEKAQAKKEEPEKAQAKK